MQKINFRLIAKTMIYGILNISQRKESKKMNAIINVLYYEYELEVLLLEEQGSICRGQNMVGKLRI